MRAEKPLCYTLPMTGLDKQAGVEHHGHRERLRERFAKAGLDGFAPHEALELLLTFAIPRQDVNPLAHRLLHHFGSFNRVLEASVKDLQVVPGIGKNAATLIALLLPLFRQYRQGIAEGAAAISGTESMIEYCQALLMGERLERFFVLCLDARGRLITHAMISSGDEGETAVYPRLIAKELLRSGAESCVLAHNHPSGLAHPSRADIELTAALKTILAPLSIALADHVIIAGDEFFSFANNGLIR